MRTVLFVTAVCWLLALPVAAAEQHFEDALLDRLVGNWVMTGTIAGGAITHDLVAEWVLGHQYLRFHEVAREKDSSGAPAYEAIVFIGWDKPTGRYACLWLDVTGTSNFAPVGYAKPDGEKLAFDFDMGTDGIIHTTFVYRREADSWDWLVDMENGDEIRPFARVSLARR